MPAARDFGIFACQACNRGVDERRLRKDYGHSLSKLLIDAKNEGLQIGILTLGTLEQLEQLDEAHSEFWSRYPRKVKKPVFLIENFESYAAEIFRAVNADVRGSAF